MEEIPSSVGQNARYTAMVRFREARPVVEAANERARAQGTQLASVLRGLLRQWLARDTIYKEGE